MRVADVVTALVAGSPALAGAQAATSMGAPGVEPITVRWNLPDDRFVDRRTPLEFSLSRPLAPHEGEIAILIGSTDVTDVLESRGATLVYRPRIAPLPAGERDVVVYRRTANAWAEIQRFPLRVLTRRGLVRASVAPSTTLGTNGQLAHGRSSGTPAPERTRFQDLTITSGLRSSHQGATWSIESQGNVAGASRRDHALRFAQRGAEAPRVDLSDYVVTVNGPRTRLALGHVSVGDHRHLANAFASRGLTVTSTVGPTALTLGAVNGTSIVGWDNVVGLERPNHRVVSLGLTGELLPSRPGALKASVSTLDGSLLPEQSFAQGAVVDAERSKGFGVQVSGVTPGERLRVAAGYAQSRFANPARDPELLGDSSIVPVASETRAARYAELGVAVVKDVTLPRVGAVALATGYRHERVDPLYRSAAASVQADQQQHAFDVNGSIGVIAAQIAHTRSRDNLDDVASVLRTSTRQSTVTATIGLPSAAPLVRFASYLPTLSLSLGWTHQFAATAPTNGNFRPQDLPDQQSVQRELSGQWQVRTIQLTYRYNETHQDNRQPERERADFGTNVHAVSATRAFGPSGDAGVELSAERQRAAESGLTSHVRRIGLTGTWRPLSSTALTASLSNTLSRDASRADGSRNTEGRFEVSRSFLRVRRGEPRGQLFLRYGTTAAQLPLDPTTDSAARLTTQRQWNLASGLNLTLF